MVTTEVFAGASGVFEAPQMTGLARPSDWFVDWVRGQQTSEAGVSVNETTMLTHGPLWQGVNILAGDIGLMPFNVYQTDNADSYTIARLHPVQRVLTKKTNTFQTPAVWKEWAMATAIIWGNSLSYILRDNRNAVIGLVPLPPEWCGFDIDENDTPYYYVQHPKKGTIPYRMDEIFHLRGLTTDGFWGLRLAEVAAGTIGFGIALRKHGNATFKNGWNPGGALEHPGKLTPEAMSNLRAEMDKFHKGSSKAGATLLLAEGMKWNPYKISNVDFQWLEAMQLNVSQVAAILMLPPFKLGHMQDSSVRANLEEQNRDYYNTSLARHANKIREEANDKLLSVANLEVWHDATELLKGDLHTQMETAQLAMASTIWTRNEARIYVGQNPVKGGDEFANPNTTSGSGGNPDTTSTDTNEIKQRARALVAERASHLCRAEASRLASKAKTRKNFCEFVDTFYSGEFQTLAGEVLQSALHMASLVSPLAKTESAIESHAKRCKTRAYEYAGKATTPAELSELFTDHWPQKALATQLVALLYGETIA